MEIAKAVLRWLRKNESWLLVFDNLDDIHVVGYASSVEPCYLPDIKPGGHVLITTWDSNTFGIPAQGLEVGCLEADEAVELLLQHGQVQHEDTPSIRRRGRRSGCEIYETTNL
jgi:hypothetical protein